MNWIFKLCIVNMKRRKTRTFLTMLGVMIGVISVVAMLSLGMGVRQYMLSEFGEDGATKIIITSHSVKYKDKLITDKKIEEISGIVGVKEVYPEYMVDMNIKYDKYSSYIGIIGIPKEQIEKLKLSYEAQEISGTRPEVIIGGKVNEEFYNDDFTSSMKDKDIATSEMYGERLKISIYDYITGATINDNFKVCGVVEAKENRYSDSDYVIYCDIDTLKKYLTHKAKNGVIYGQPVNEDGERLYYDFIYNQAIIKVTDIDHVEPVVKKLKDMGFEVENNKEYVDKAEKEARMIQLLLFGIGMIALVVAVIGIGNTMTTSVYDRVNEIGILKVLGCDLDELRTMFLLEAGIIGAVGAVFGVAFSFAIRRFINMAAVSLLELAKGTEVAVIPWWLIVVAIAGATIVAIIAGYFPARWAAKLKPVDAVSR